MNSQINTDGANSRATTLLLSWLACQRLGSVLTSGALSVVPVYAAPAPDATNYRTLREAVDLGEALVAEQGQASVSGVQVLNCGPLPVLILDGEELVGGLQNRLANTTLLIPPTTSFDMPVSCIEHGRWYQTVGVFEVGEAVHPTLRRQKSQQVTASLHRIEAPLANQQAIWAEVEERHRLTGTRSATGALRDTYVQRGADLERTVEGLSYPSDGPTGVVALVDGRALCADLFDRPETLRVYWDRLVRSYALETLGREACELSVASAARLLRRPGGAILAAFPSIGVGIDVRINGNGVVGAALVHGTTVMHAGLFRHRERPAGSEFQNPGTRARRIARRNHS